MYSLVDKIFHQCRYRYFFPVWYDIYLFRSMILPGYYFSFFYYQDIFLFLFLGYFFF